MFDVLRIPAGFLTIFFFLILGRGGPRGGRGGTPRGGGRGGMKIDFNSGGTGANKKMSFD